MEKPEAEKLTEKFMDPVFRFALKRCRSVQDAEDLTQNILLRAYRALLRRDDLENCEQFLWTIAHNSLANYYRKEERRYTGISPDDAAELAADLPAPDADVIFAETAQRLTDGIARLSALRRRLVIGYYYENKRLRELAEECALPIGTVKWHLFEAKRDLKEEMESMRTENELKFNPVRFSRMGFSGCAGTMGGTQAFFRSALAQNIAYCTYREELSAQEIAARLGVSPVYVESELDFLQKYGYMLERKGKYRANILIDEADETGKRINRLMDSMYAEAADVFANELYVRLTEGGLLEKEGIACGRKGNKNFLLWALIPYITANSGSKKDDISFEEVAVRRIDGSHDIAYADLEGSYEGIRYGDSMQKWCGPSWVSLDGNMLWKCISEEVCGERENSNFSEDLPRSEDLKLFLRMERGGMLSPDEYASLAERGFIRMQGGCPVLQVVRIADRQTNDSLLAVGTQIREKTAGAFKEIKSAYTRAVLENTSEHLRPARTFLLQYLFKMDGWFLIYVLKELQESGRLAPPKEDEKKSLMTLIAPC